MRHAYLSLSVTMLLWGSAFASSKAVVEHVPHTVAALLRFGGGALALIVAVAVSGRPRGVASGGLRAAGRAALAGVLGVFGYNTFFFWGLSMAPSLDGGILIPVLSPVLTSLFVLFVNRRRPSVAQLVGFGLGLGGAVVFFLGAAGAEPVGSTRLAGDACYLLGAVCWSGYTLAAPRVLAGIDPLRATTWATVAGAGLLAVAAAPDLGRVSWGELPAGVWLNVVFLAVGATAIANLLYYRAIGEVGPASASLMMFVVPAVGTLCATLLLGESFRPVQAAGAVVLISGAVVILTRNSSHYVVATRKPSPLPGRRPSARPAK